MNETSKLTWGGLLQRVLVNWKILTTWLPEFSFFGGLVRTITGGRTLLSSEELLQGLRGCQHIHDYAEGVTCHHLVEGGWESVGTDKSMNDFSALLPMRSCKNWVHNFFSGKLSNSLLVCCVSFPEHRVPLSNLHPELLSEPAGGQETQWVVTSFPLVYLLGTRCQVTF